MLSFIAQRVQRSLLLFLASCLLLEAAYLSFSARTSDRHAENRVQQVRTGHGGRWHIPLSWKRNETSASGCGSDNIVDAAECALGLALENGAFLDNTRIPLIAHQTSRSADPATWSEGVRRCVERWIAAATSRETSDREMAWFMWDDDGLDGMVRKYENDFYPSFSALPYAVERADAFRVLSVKWFGGVYVDLDSQPLRHPSNWVRASDVKAWTDKAGNVHAQH